MTKVEELKSELKTLFSVRGAGLLDSLFPPLVFLLMSQVTILNTTLLGAVITAGLIAIFRIVHRQNIWYALGGLAGVLLAAFFAKLSGSQSGFYLPGFISGAVTVVLCVVSVLVRRPLAAWSSSLTRRWPLKWYWHARVRPAYSEVTLMWAFAFAARLAFEYALYQREAANALGAVRLLLGWPYTILLLVLSYLYGLWRLKGLQGPSVEEFKSGAQPPWQGQRRGF